MRTTVEQNLRPALGERGRPARASTRALAALGLGRAGAETITDVTAPARAPTPASSASPSSRGAGRGAATRLLEAAGLDRDAAPSGLRIKASGCFNSCGQHHVADLGFLGVSRNVGGRRVPHFQVVVGGQWTEQRRLLRPRHRGGAVEADARGRQAAHRLATPRSAGRRVVRGLRAAASARRRSAPWSRSCRRCPTTSRTRALQRLGRSARVHHRATWGWGSARARWSPTSRSGWPRAERELFEAAGAARRGERPTGATARALGAMLQAARALAREKNAQPRQRPRRDRRRVPQAPLRHPAVLRPVRRGQVRPLLLPRLRGAGPRPRPRRRCTSSSRRRRSSSTPPTSAIRRLGSALRRLPPRNVMDAHKLQLKIYVTPDAARAVPTRGVHPGASPLDQGPQPCPSWSSTSPTTRTSPGARASC